LDVWEVKTSKGHTIQVTKLIAGQAARAGTDPSYICHGLSFGGTNAPGGPFSPVDGAAAKTILADAFKQTPRPGIGDLIVFYDPDGNVKHTAVVIGTYPVLVLVTKNGIAPLTEMTIFELIQLYGDSFEFRTRK
jgi:hypothetical protein